MTRTNEPATPSQADFDTDRDPVDVLAEEFARRCRLGERPSVSEYAERFPQWAEQLRALLPPVAKMEQWKRLRKEHAVSWETMPPQKIGDFRILREVGRGGMGIVFEAVQESLGRRVALKILPKHFLLDTKKLERFHREAQAAARLHHTNIVPVFGVGEQDGLHYYVMQFIEGLSLNELLAEWRQMDRTDDARQSKEIKPDPTLTIETPEPKDDLPKLSSSLSERPSDKSHWSLVAQIGVQVALAIHYAHQQGTLHRDIKPANLLLDRHGTVWVTDFGLAKLADQKDLTKSGDILGTVAYMAPECFHGQADVQSDVYSLGLTLCELLTRQAPFRETNPAKLIQQVCAQEPLRPRKLKPAIPHDLETIILKAIAREPKHRYRSAAALANDLNRFLKDQPIQARRATAAERLWRWCRRNRALAALSAAALASFVLAAVVGWVAYVHTRKALQGESQKSQEAKKATEVAERNVNLSLEHFEEIFNRLAQRNKSLPGLGRHKIGKAASGKFAPASVSEEDAALLKSVLNFYDRFAEQNTTNLRLQREASRAYRRVGDIHLRLGQLDKAADAFRRATAILEKLVVEFPSNPDYRYELAKTYSWFDAQIKEPARLEVAAGRLRKALAVSNELFAQYPDELGYPALLARIHGNLATALHLLGQPDKAQVHFLRAVAVLKNSPRQSVAAVIDLATARLALADFWLRENQPTKARSVVEESLANLEMTLKKNLRARRANMLRGNHYECLATALTRLGETTLAAEASRKAAELLSPSLWARFVLGYAKTKKIP